MTNTSLLTVAVQRAPCAIIGVGNALMCDDAFGPAMIRELEGLPLFAQLGERVELVDAGTAGFDLMHQLLGRERVLLLDAVAPRDGEPAGTMRLIEHDELLAMSHHNARGTPHEPSILAALHVADLAGALPQVTLLGVVPADVSMGTHTSEAVRAAMPDVVAWAATWAAE
ncbi:hydrogenase maturation protease [Gemmatimonas sp.]